MAVKSKTATDWAKVMYLDESMFEQFGTRQKQIRRPFPQSTVQSPIRGPDNEVLPKHYSVGLYVIKREEMGCFFLIKRQQ